MVQGQETKWLAEKLYPEVEKFVNGQQDKRTRASAYTPVTCSENRPDDESARSKLRGGMTLTGSKGELCHFFVGIRVMPPRNLELADSSSDRFSLYMRGV